jgi:hypothetical protein
MANKFQLRRLTARALELALEARDWPQIAACKAELHAFEEGLASLDLKYSWIFSTTLQG